jgi:sirohydrochlorin cobaltochelatase
LFAEVVCAFWKEEPTMREVYSLVESREVYAVPVFISEGYFCQEVLPRELRVQPPTSDVDGKRVHYCDPVGIHPNMTQLLLQRADEVAPGAPRDQTALIVVGHGTSLNENSRKVIEDQVALIRASAGFAEVHDAYMEEAPLIKDWTTMTTSPHVVVVPFFIADGLHSFQDIPVMLGIEEEGEGNAAASERDIFRQNPHHTQGRTLYYSSAIGTEPHLADVILDQVMAFDAKHAPEPLVSACGALDAWLAAQFESDELRVGQLRVLRAGDAFTLHHVDEAPITPTHHAWQDARAIANTDARGKFRALKSAPTLRGGWCLRVQGMAELRLALDAFYPGAVGLARQQAQGVNAVSPLRAYLGRQTGMYRFTNTISDADALTMVASCCDSNTKCLRRIVWPISDGVSLPHTASAAGPGVIELLCIEACPLIAGAARKIAQDNHQRAQAAAS